MTFLKAARVGGTPALVNLDHVVSLEVQRDGAIVGIRTTAGLTHQIEFDSVDELDRFVAEIIHATPISLNCGRAS